MIILHILFIILSLVVILLLVALINTIRIKDKNLSTESLDIDHKVGDLYAKEFSEMIKIKTLSYDIDKDNAEPFRNMQKVMKEIFPNVYSTLEQTTFKGESILFKWKGKSNEKPIVLMAHQDVVPANKSDWKYEPFGGEITDTEIYGRGTLDTKSTLYGFFKAIDELIEAGFTPEHDVYISSSTDEETSGGGAGYSVKALQDKGIIPYFVLDEGGAIVSNSLPSAKKPIALIGVIEKGYVDIKFTAKSNGGHS